MKRFLTIATVVLVAAMLMVAPAQAEWQVSKYDALGTVGYNFLGTGLVSGQQFVLDSFESAAISATAGATMTMFAGNSGTVITSGVNSAGATTIVGTTASGSSAFWNTTASAGDLVVARGGGTDPNDQAFLVAVFVSGSTTTGTVKGLNADIPDGTTLYRFTASTGNLAFEAPTVSKPIFVSGYPVDIADFTTTNYSKFPAAGLSCPVGEACVFQSYSGAVTTHPAAYLRGKFVPYK